jgi:hypothetical protein
MAELTTFRLASVPHQEQNPQARDQGDGLANHRSRARHANLSSHRLLRRSELAAMNDLSDTIGLMRRELRAVRAVVSNIDHRARKLGEPANHITPHQRLAKVLTCHAIDPRRPRRLCRHRVVVTAMIQNTSWRRWYWRANVSDEVLTSNCE